MLHNFSTSPIAVFALVIFLAIARGMSAAPMNAPRKPFADNDSAHETDHKASAAASRDERVPCIVEIDGHKEMRMVDVDMAATPLGPIKHHMPTAMNHVNHPPNGLTYPCVHGGFATNAAGSVLGFSSDGALAQAHGRLSPSFHKRHRIATPSEETDDMFNLLPPIGIDPFHSLLMNPYTKAFHEPSDTYPILRYLAQQPLSDKGNLDKLMRVLSDPDLPPLTAIDANRLMITLSKATSERGKPMAALRIGYGDQILPTTISFALDPFLLAERTLSMFQIFDEEMAKLSVDENFMLNLCASPLIDEQELTTGDTLYLRAAKLNRPDIFGRLALCGCNPLISDSQGMTATTVMERLIMKQPLLCAIINNVKPCAGSPSSLQAPPPEAMLIELPVAGHVPGERVHIDSTSAAQPDPTIPIFSEGDINWNEIRTIFETMIEERDEADDGVL